MELTERQEMTLAEFKARVCDLVREHHDDTYMVDWLKARKFDIKKSEAMFRKSMAWRAEMQADRILDDWKIPSVMKDYYPGGILGRDKEGAVVVIDAFGRADLKGIMRSVKRVEIMKTMAYRVEMAKRMKGVPGEGFRELGAKPNKIVYILDMTSFSTKTVMTDSTMKLIGEITRMLEDNYPETLKKTYFINASRVFVAAYELVKRFLNKDTASKCKMLGLNWHSEVFKLVDPSVIPKYYGGERVDENGDEKCSSVIGYGGQVPQSCYRTIGECIPEGCSLKHSIGQKRTFSVPVQITTPNSYLQWVFATEKGEINLSVTRHPENPVKGSKAVTVFPCKRVGCDILPEEGVLTCTEPGKYTVKFENPSVIHSKKLTYHVQVTEPETREDVDDNISEEALRASMERLTTEDQVFADDDSGVQGESDTEGSTAGAAASSKASDESSLSSADHPAVTNGDCSKEEADESVVPNQEDSNSSSASFQENSLTEQPAELVSA